MVVAIDRGSNVPKYALFEFCMQKLEGVKILLVDDPNQHGRVMLR